MKTFTYKDDLTENENWKRWVKFRFGNTPDELLEWNEWITFDHPNFIEEMTLREANEWMKSSCLKDDK